ncbi:hypothetical protein AQUCO_00400326v1 [Aquilegia coerulea]|uniref:non-specific serine/threonine protein kinase n=1 Tax=Aquilegia coerulea TaxID=218851 RepID=A0A2G5EUC5_AQUCA|nr:hypothetical protein AQUCO_00400326v1 [Aquilegia coerulea]
MGRNSEKPHWTYVRRYDVRTSQTDINLLTTWTYERPKKVRTSRPNKLSADIPYVQNNFGGVFPYSIVNLSTKMQFLCLGGNQLYGIIPNEIGNLVNLITLGLENNMFNGSIPSSIGNIKNLQGLFLNGNKLTGSVNVVEILTGKLEKMIGERKLTQLSELSLSTNRLEGSIPLSFGGYLNLQSLNLSRNNLSNTIPKQIFSIHSLSILLDLSHNSFTGSLPSEVGQLKSLGYIDVSGNRLSGEIPSTLANCLGLEVLHMESNMLEGKIPQSLSSLKNIQYIDLSSNNLSGPIPKYLENFQSLQRLNLSFNKLEGEIPMKGIFQNASSVSVAGNFKLCGGIHELLFPTCPIKGHQKEGRSVVLKVAIGSSSVALFFLLASSFLIVYWRRKPKPRASSSISLRDRHLKVSYKDLFQATNGFSPTNFVGSGSFGRVYKGMLGQEERIVAVKVFDLQHEGASKSFMAECESLRQIRHRNLVKILTSCSTTDFEGNDFKSLVFEFMPNGSLEKWLPGFVDGQDDPSRNLNLLQRLNIAIDVASALNYLHHQCHVSIIHRDLKPSNILLDNDMVAHVGDFGLAKLLPGSIDNVYKSQSISIGIKGTIGYAAPEYGMGGDASTQGDVYSYGILLLELFTGRRPTEKVFIDGLNLHNFARMALPNRVLEILDPALLSEDGVQSLNSKKQTMQEIIASLVRIGVACSSESPGERMNMEEVSSDLNLTRDIFLASLGREHL